MTQTITLILFINGEDWEVNTIYTETILKSGLKFELFVYDESESEVAKTLFSDFANEYKKNNTFDSKTKALNHFLKNASGNHFVILQNNQLLSKNWLTDFIYYYENLEQVGILTIPTNSETKNLKYSHALCRNLELCDVLISDNFETSGVISFSKRTLNELGAFDESLDLKLAIHQYLFRSKLSGTNNYFIPNISSMSLSEQNTISEEQHFLLEESFLRIKKTKQLFIQLYQLSIKEELAYLELETVCKTLSTYSENFFHRFTGEFGIFTKELSHDDITTIQQFCAKFDLKFTLTTFFENQRNFIKTNILVILKSI